MLHIYMSYMWVGVIGAIRCFGHMTPTRCIGAIEPIRDMGLIGTIGNINPPRAIHMGS